MQICLLERHTVDFAFRHPIYQASKNGVHQDLLATIPQWSRFWHLGPKLQNWSLSQKPGSIGLGHNHSHLTDSTAAILGNHERGVQAGSQLKLQCRILKILQPHEKPPFDETMKWLHNGQKVSNCLGDWQHQKLSNCPKKWQQTSLVLSGRSPREMATEIMFWRHDVFCVPSVSPAFFVTIETTGCFS